MAPVYKIAVIQLHPKPMQPESNFLRASTFIARAALQGAHLAVLPEYHLTNWVPNDPGFIPLCAQWETYLRKYQALAKDHDICIVPGTIVEWHPGGAGKKEEDRLINVAYFIDNKGDILGSYQKKNLWHPERPHLTPSPLTPHLPIRTPLGPIGLLICWDLAFPEAFRELISHGAKLIIIPTFWTLSDCSAYGLSLNPRAEALFLEAALTARACEGTCGVVFANAGGPGRELRGSGKKMSGHYAGMSRVVLPFVGALGEETKDGWVEGMSVVDVDMRVLEEAEMQYKIREDMGREDWHYFYGRGGEGGREKGKL